jgi:glycosyltransferase involved in cell wall biosynthesis
LDCFVLPSLSEGTSCTLQEAMACGQNLVATAVGGNPQLLDDGRYGLLVPSEDVTGLCQAMGRFFAHQGPLPDVAANREVAQRQYSLPAMLERYRRLFQPA